MRFAGAVFIVTIASIAVIFAGEVGTSPAVIKTQGFLPFAGAPINYRSADVDDPVARLEERLERGEVSLDYEPQHGYLRSVLKALHVPVNSQTLVFAKTSFQFPQINPERPRALYYNDDVYVGQVHNGKFLEFVSFDPKQGPIFYVIDERQTDHPRFERAAVDCVQCHVAKSTRGVPGVMLRSVFTKPDGNLAAGAKSYVTGQESPFPERWGGWYVTATKGGEPGFANATVSNVEHPEQVERPAVANLTSLSGKLDTSAYLTGSSDIVALLVLVHQTQMHNLITETSYRTRLAFYAEQQKNKAAGLPQDTISEKARNQFEVPAEQLVQYLLFANEAPLETSTEGNTTLQRILPHGAHLIRKGAHCASSICRPGSSNTRAAT
jgi:hypothetical protein